LKSGALHDSDMAFWRERWRYPDELAAEVEQEFKRFERGRLERERRRRERDRT
jgi:hypothetical protein